MSKISTERPVRSFKSGQIGNSSHNKTPYIGSGGNVIWFEEHFGAVPDNTWNTHGVGVSISGGLANELASSGSDNRITCLDKVGSPLNDTLWYADFQARLTLFNSACNPHLFDLMSTNDRAYGTAGDLIGFGIGTGSNIGYCANQADNGTAVVGARLNTGNMAALVQAYLARESATTAKAKLSGFADRDITITSTIIDLDIVTIANDALNSAGRYGYGYLDDLYIHDNEVIPP